MNSNGNAVGGLFLLLLIVLSIIAIFGAKGKWKAINLGIIAFAIAIGIGIGVGLGAWGNNYEVGGHLAATLMPITGSCGAYVCIRRNKRRVVPGV